MYAFLETIWPISVPSSQPCGGTEVDVSGLSGMSLLEWIGEPGPECTDAFDRTEHRLNAVVGFDDELHASAVKVRCRSRAGSSPVESKKTV